MFKRILSRYIGFPLQDIFRNTKISQTATFLSESEGWARQKIDSYQLEKLRRLIMHAYEHVPYYRRLFDSLSLKPEMICSLQDFQRIPILTKENARRAGDELFATNITRNIKKGKTGGTTGVPLYLRRDANTRSFTWGAYYRWYGSLGIKRGDPIVELWGAPEVFKSRFYSRLRKIFLQYFQNTMVINSFDLNSKSLPSYVKKIDRFKPRVMRGYLSAILYLAEYLDKNNITMSTPEIVTTTSETLYPHHRSYLEKVFGTRVYNQYGCGECGSIAFESGDTNDLFITREHVVIETINDENDPVTDSPGRVLLTDLDNYAMVFLRYENGDIATMSYRKNKDGVDHPVLKEILGREKDTIILRNGSQVHGVFFTDIFYELNNVDLNTILRFQVYQDTPGSIIFRIESNSVVPGKSVSELEKSLRNFFDEVKIEIYGSLPRNESGKFKYIISEIKNENIG